jgi:hypothetical protein
VVAGLEDLEGLLESRHGCVWGEGVVGLAVVIASFDTSCWRGSGMRGVDEMQQVRGQRATRGYSKAGGVVVGMVVPASSVCWRQTGELRVGRGESATASIWR